MTNEVLKKFHEAAKQGNIKVISSLLEKGTNVDAVDKNKNAALHWASEHGHLEVVKLLLEKGAKIDLKNNMVVHLKK